MNKCPFKYDCKNCSYLKVEETTISYVHPFKGEITIPYIPNMVCTYDENFNKGDE